MKTREQIQKELLESIREDVFKNNKDWNDVAVVSPKKGKNSWTYREVYMSIQEDKCLEDSDNNMIDSMIRYYEWKERYK
jgi:hypothetical protein